MVLYFFFGCCYSENHFAKSSYELNNYRAARDFIIFSSANSNPQAIYAIIRFPWNCIVHGLKRSCGFIFFLHFAFFFRFLAVAFFLLSPDYCFHDEQCKKNGRESTANQKDKTRTSYTEMNASMAGEKKQKLITTSN